MTRTLVGALCVLSISACAGEQQLAPPPPPPPVVVAPPPAAAEPPPPPPKPSLADLERATLQIVAAGLNAHDAAKVANAYAEDALIRAAGFPEVEGRAAVQASTEEMFQTFSNVKLGARRTWSFGDLVAVEWVLNGNYSGTLFGTKGKDQPIGYVGLSLMWFDADGRVKEEHRYADLATAAKQVSGKAPVPPIPEIPAAPQSFAPPPDAASQVEVARSVFGAIENKNEKDLLARLTDDVTVEGPMGKATGKTDAKKLFASFAKAFPDARLTITNAWGTTDGALVEYVLTGTQKGAIEGIAPTNRAVALHAVDVMKIADGKVSSIVTYANGLELANELGASKPEKAAAHPKAPAPAAPPTAKK